MNIVRSAFGQYETIGNPEDADFIFGHSFGTSTDGDSASRQIANMVSIVADGRPVFVDRHLADSFADPSFPIDRIVEGQISNTMGAGVGTWGALLDAKQFMQERQLVRPMLIAQAHHVGRIAMQAKRLDLEVVIPAGLPTKFDQNSDQPWTRSLGMWVPREVLGSFVLRAQKKL